MKTIITSAIAFLFALFANAQEEPKNDPDTMRINLHNKEILVIQQSEDSASTEKKHKHYEGHWAGVEFGPTVLMNSNFATNFPGHPEFKNDPGKSFSWNLNLLEHKFPIAKNYFGIVTGLGFNFKGVGLGQYMLSQTDSSLVATKDTVNVYDKNKLRATYLTVPLLLEFCSSGDASKTSFYLDAGIVAGVRIGSSVKTIIDGDKHKVKDAFGLNAFKLDAAVRMGYGNVGIFAYYSLLPLFDKSLTAAAYPLNVGVSFNF